MLFASAVPGSNRMWSAVSSLDGQMIPLDQLARVFISAGTSAWMCWSRRCSLGGPFTPTDSSSARSRLRGGARWFQYKRGRKEVALRGEPNELGSITRAFAEFRIISK
ncbi:hypothetical protein L914_07742 [Phytophthora nicotianae]|uniref:Uncharacterized protein n=1 Tax=Phytophthora nicotianae TaxID=4792 RepID=W2NHZ5_PHYNI|nr:hypothetical protein L914_07742 [Phytophthora nicotianae]